MSTEAESLTCPRGQGKGGSYVPLFCRLRVEGGPWVQWTPRREVVHEPACGGPVPPPPSEVPGCRDCGVHAREGSRGPGIGSSQGGPPT